MNSSTPSAPVINPPHDLDAERALLSSLLMDRGAIIQIAPLMKPSDFYEPKHCILYQTILALYEQRKPADLVLIYNELERAGKTQDIGGIGYAAGLLQAEMTPVHANYYAQIVREMAIRRQHIGLGGEVAKLAYDTSQPIDAMLSAIAQLGGATDLLPNDPYISANEAVTALMDRLDVALPPRVCKTGYADLDHTLRGLLDGWLVVVGARTGKGKTSFGAGLLYEHCVKRRRPGLLISLEMSAETIMQRMLAIASKSDTSGLLFEANRDFGRYAAITEAAGLLSNSGLVMVRNPSAEWGVISAQIRELVAARGVELVVIDYVGLMHDKVSAKLGRVAELSAITRGLKLLAMNLGVPVVGLQQLNRKVDERGEDAEPRLSDLRESGSFEQDADVVLFVSHNEPKDGQNTTDAVFKIAKNRHGRTGTIRMQWHAPTAQFRDVQKGAAA